MQYEQEFKIGQQVRVPFNEHRPWTADWKDGTYIVTGAILEYRNGDPQVKYSLATQEEIEHRLGDTDGLDQGSHYNHGEAHVHHQIS